MSFKLNTETTCFRKGVGFHSKPVVASAPIDVFIIIFFLMDHAQSRIKGSSFFSRSNQCYTLSITPIGN